VRRTDIAGTDGPPDDELPPLLEEELPPDELDELEDEELEEDELPPDDDAPDELEPPPPEQAAIPRQAPTRTACTRRAARPDDLAWCIVIPPSCRPTHCHAFLSWPLVMKHPQRTAGELLVLTGSKNRSLPCVGQHSARRV
jgi:hypothetical protein